MNDEVKKENDPTEEEKAAWDKGYNDGWEAALNEVREGIECQSPWENAPEGYVTAMAGVLRYLFLCSEEWEKAMQDEVDEITGQRKSQYWIKGISDREQEITWRKKERAS